MYRSTPCTKSSRRLLLWPGPDLFRRRQSVDPIAHHNIHNDQIDLVSVTEGYCCLCCRQSLYQLVIRGGLDIHLEKAERHSLVVHNQNLCFLAQQTSPSFCKDMSAKSTTYSHQIIRIISTPDILTLDYLSEFYERRSPNIAAISAFSASSASFASSSRSSAVPVSARCTGSGAVHPVTGPAVYLIPPSVLFSASAIPRTS